MAKDDDKVELPVAPFAAMFGVRGLDPNATFMAKRKKEPRQRRTMSDPTPYQVARAKKKAEQDGI